jgi:hypothetical protein
MSFNPSLKSAMKWVEAAQILFDENPYFKIDARSWN